MFKAAGGRAGVDFVQYSAPFWACTAKLKIRHPPARPHTSALRALGTVGCGGGSSKGIHHSVESKSIRRWWRLGWGAKCGIGVGSMASLHNRFHLQTSRTTLGQSLHKNLGSTEVSHLSFGPSLHTSIPHQSAARAHALFLKNHGNGSSAMEPCGKRLVYTIRRGYFRLETTKRNNNGRKWASVPPTRQRDTRVTH